MPKLGCERRSTQKAVATPNDRELWWLAGFLEGEGSFVSTGGGGRKRCEMVSARQVQREPLERVISLLGGRIHSYTPNNPKAQPAHDWVVSGSRARGVMLTLYPLLSPRRQQQIHDVLDKTCVIVQRPMRTHCIRGHELDYVAPKTGHRGCKRCRSDAQHRRWQKIVATRATANV